MTCKTTGCKEDLTVLNIKYSGEPLTCISIEEGNNLQTLFQNINSVICSLKSNINNSLGIKNIGAAFPIYANKDLQGVHQIKSLRAGAGVTLTNTPNEIIISRLNLATNLSYDLNTNTLSSTYTDGTVRTVVLDFQETNTSIAFDSVTSTFTYVDETGIATSVDLSTVLAESLTSIRKEAGDIVYTDENQQETIITLPKRTSDLINDGNGTNVLIVEGDNNSLLSNDSGFITGYAETDPIFLASPSATITSQNIVNWNNSTNVVVDQTIVDGSTNAVSGNATFDALQSKLDLIGGVLTGNLSVPDGSIPSHAINKGQLDLAVAAFGALDGSETIINAGTNTNITGVGTIVNPYVINTVGGGGESVTFDGVPVNNSVNAVTSGGLFNEFLTKSNTGHTHTTSQITDLSSYLGFDVRFLGINATASNSSLLNGQAASFYYPASNPNGYVSTNTTYTAGTGLSLSGGNAFSLASSVENRVALNDAKIGITAGQASAITLNTAKIGLTPNSVVTSTIIDGAVINSKIADNTITSAKLANTAVTAGDYTNSNITVNSKGQVTAASNGAAGGGGTTYTAGSGITLTGTVFSQTQRTINGTNYNGSANITTAIWGTSRNISIGGTLKAVNGSVNVTWTQAELGITQSNINSLNINATTLSGVTSAQFLRNDVNGTLTGNFTATGVITANVRMEVPNAVINDWAFRADTNNANSSGLYFSGADAQIILRNAAGTTAVLQNNGTGFTTAGTVTATNFILSSDKRLKTEIKCLVVKPIPVKWKQFELKADRGQYRTGVIAQELEKTNPEFVRTNDEGMKSVAYIDLLIAKIAELEFRILKLENKN